VTFRLPWRGMLASIIGGAIPVPGGMGVVEAGLIVV
jgi:hypothetical protein